MAKKKSGFDSAVKKAAAILQDHFNSLPDAEAKQKRAEFHQLTLAMGRASRGKASRARRTSATRRKYRSSAKRA